MRTFSKYFALFRCMRIDQDRVGETTSMYANRLVCETTCMRNDRLRQNYIDALYVKRKTLRLWRMRQIGNKEVETNLTRIINVAS